MQAKILGPWGGATVSLKAVERAYAKARKTASTGSLVREGTLKASEGPAPGRPPPTLQQARRFNRTGVVSRNPQGAERRRKKERRSNATPNQGSLRRAGRVGCKSAPDAAASSGCLKRTKTLRHRNVTQRNQPPSTRKPTNIRRTLGDAGAQGLHFSFLIFFQKRPGRRSPLRK